MMTVALLVAWMAAGYRLWVTLTSPLTIWRTSFTIGMVSSATALTLWNFRLEIDSTFHVWNLASLLARAIFVAGIGFTLIYVDSLRSVQVIPGTVRRHLLGAAAVIVVLVLTWLLGPVHDQPYPNLLPLADNLAVALYCAIFWCYMGWGLVEIARLCLARGRTFRREDRARSVMLLLTGIAALSGLPVLMLWTVAVLIRHFVGLEATRLTRLGDALLPVPVLAQSIGVLSLLTIPWAGGMLTSRRRLKELQPLWSELVRRYPQVHLVMKPTGGPLTRMRMYEERAIIEIRDALRVARVDLDGPSTVDNIALALGKQDSGGHLAAELLEKVDTREADVRQILALARAYEAAQS